MKKNINITKKFEVKFNIRYICQTFFVTDLDFGFTPLSIARTVKLMGWFPIIRTFLRITIKPELFMWNMFCEKIKKSNDQRRFIKSFGIFHSSLFHLI